MITTTSAYGPSSIRNKYLSEIAPPAPSSPNVPQEPPLTKEKLLEKYIEQYVKGELTEKQLQVITKTLQ